MTEREARIAFNLFSEIGTVTFEKRVREAGGDWACAYSRYAADVGEVDWKGEIARAERQHVALVTAADEAYPVPLRKIASPPLVLYVAGNVQALSRDSVALVGTRRPSAYGRDMAEKLGFGLAAAGWTIVSGLALGVDAAAHRGALAAKGITVGILGGALDKFYPEGNRALARQIVAAGGAVVSEFPFGRSPDARTFPQRNRVVAGLCQGIVAVEAPERSGTLITCARGIEAGRSVMAIPGRVDSPYSTGCLALIREGATLVRNVEDVLEELKGFKTEGRPTLPKGQSGVCRTPALPGMESEVADAPKSEARREHSARPNPQGAQACARHALPKGLSAEECRIVEILAAGKMTVDTVSARTGIAVASLYGLLTGLRLKQRIVFLPGNRVALKD